MRPRVAAAGCAVGLACGWNVANVGAVAEELADAYGVSLAAVGLFSTALFVVHTALQIPAGQAVDRLGARRVALAALGVLAAANAAALAAPEPGLAVGARALAGIGLALGFVAGSDYVRDLSGSAFLQGLYGGVALAGGGLAVAIVPQLDPLGWRAPYLTAAALAPLAAALLAAAPSGSPRSHGRRGLAQAAALVGDSRLYRLCVLYSASLGLAVIAGNWVTTLLARAGDFEEGTAGAVGALVLAAGVVSRPLGGWIARTHPARTRDAVAASIAASAVATGALAAAGPLPVAVVASLVLGLGSGIAFAPAFGAAAATRPDAPAAAVGLVNMAANATIVVGTPLVGLAFSLPGDGRIGFAALAALWLLALAFLPSARLLAVR